MEKRAIFVIAAVVTIVIIAVIIIGGSSSFSRVSGASDQKPQVSPVKAREKLSREFMFPLLNDQNKEIGKIKYIIESAELQDQIFVKGQEAKAIKGKTFLVINLKIINGSDQGLNIRSRDYVRLKIDNKKELLAPDLHNDPVEVQAISTKYTRVGFIIGESEKNLQLQIGEINGEKRTVPLNLK